MHMTLDRTLMALLLLTSSGASQDSSPSNCTNSTFPVDMCDTQCFGLSQVSAAKSLSECQQSCCASSTCSVYEWCPPASTSCAPVASCWIGTLHNNCEPSTGWIARAKAKSTIYTIGTNADAVGPPFGGLGGLSGGGMFVQLNSIFSISVQLQRCDFSIAVGVRPRI